MCIRDRGNIAVTGNYHRFVSGSTNNTSSADTNGLNIHVSGSYEDGRYTSRFRKYDAGGGVPLYIDNSDSTANVFTAIARFGAYSGNSYEFEVFGDAKVNGALVSSSTVSDSIGPLRRLGIVGKSSNYTLASSDAGKLIRRTGGNATVPASVFTAGDMITIFNAGSGDTTVLSSAVTVYNSADGDTGNTRTIAAKGIATLVCTATNEFVISGSQLT